MSGTEATPTSTKRRGHRHEMVGIVTSDKMQKTVVVTVERLVRHPKYERVVKRRAKFMAHDELGARVGDKVRIMETRPLSRRKRWRVVEIIQRAARRVEEAEPAVSVEIGEGGEGV